MTRLDCEFSPTAKTGRDKKKNPSGQVPYVQRLLGRWLVYIPEKRGGAISRSSSFIVAGSASGYELPWQAYALVAVSAFTQTGDVASRKCAVCRSMRFDGMMIAVNHVDICRLDFLAGVGGYFSVRKTTHFNDIQSGHEASLNGTCLTGVFQK
uniref:Outer membrane lipoprotein n=1 Tax=Panagrellus redivivus TaxID=6233 RepID=A0A7E4ZTI1_PANRE